MQPVLLALAMLAGPLTGDGSPAKPADVIELAGGDRPRSFRGVFRHKGFVKSIQIGIDSMPEEPAHVEGVRVHVEEGCFDYTANGYIKGSRVVLVPVSIYLEHEPENRRLGLELLGEDWLKMVEERGNLEFDIASLVCHLDADRQIQKVDIVLPDLTIYRAPRDHTTPPD